MLREHEDFQGSAVSAALGRHDGTFRYCSFEAAALEGGDFGDLYAACQFRELEVEASFFHVALFYQCRFERCTFRGVSFGGCRFVECSFADCRFLPDAEGAACDAPETRLYACSAKNCAGFDALFTARD